MLLLIAGFVFISVSLLRFCCLLKSEIIREEDLIMATATPALAGIMYVIQYKFGFDSVPVQIVLFSIYYITTIYAQKSVYRGTVWNYGDDSAEYKNLTRVNAMLIFAGMFLFVLDIALAIVLNNRFMLELSNIILFCCTILIIIVTIIYSIKNKVFYIETFSFNPLFLNYIISINCIFNFIEYLKNFNTMKDIWGYYNDTTIIYDVICIFIVSVVFHGFVVPKLRNIYIDRMEQKKKKDCQ